MKAPCYFTYTHSNASDLWQAYFDRLEKYSPEGMESYVACDIEHEMQNHHFYTYDDDKNYSFEMVRILNQIPNDYFIYMQEDFFLLDHIDYDSILNYQRLLSESDLSFVRLIRCGEVSSVRYQDSSDLYWVQPKGTVYTSLTSFSMQPTIWKKKDFIRMYENAGCKKFGEHLQHVHQMNIMNMRGLYVYRNEPVVKNSNHYESTVFPYVATGVVKGKWNTSEYPNELETIFKEYGIEPNIRGVR